MVRTRLTKFFALPLFMFIMMTATFEEAVACTSPTGEGGQILFQTPNLTFCDGTNWITLASSSAVSVAADNMGDHTASQNIVLGTHYLSGDGDDEGLSIASSGAVSASTQIYFPNIGSNASPSLFFEGATSDWGLHNTGTNLVFTRNNNSGSWIMQGNSIYGNGGASSATIRSGVGASALNPTYTFNGDTNTGVYSSGADEVGFTVNGSSALHVNTSGDVAIGMTTASRNLHVNGEVRFEPTVVPASAGAGDLYFDSLDSNKLKYHNGSVWLTLADTSAAGDNLGDHTASQNLQMAGNWISNDGDSEGVYIDGSGNVGIGINDPDSLLNVQTDSGGLIFHAVNSGTTGDTYPEIRLSHYKSFAGGGYPRISSYHSRGTEASPSTVQDGMVLMSLEGRGYAEAGFGSNVAGAMIQFEAASNWSNSTIDTHMIFKTGGTTSWSAAEHMRITSEGYVGIGIAAASQTLHVDGAMRLEPNSAPGSPVAGDIYFDSASNNLQYHNGTSWVALEASSGGGADNMGDHTASQNIVLGSHYLSGDGGDEGLFVDSDGKIGVGTNSPDVPFDIEASVSSSNTHPNRAGLVVRGAGSTDLGGRIGIQNVSNSAAPVLIGLRARGTTLASPSQVQTDDNLLTMMGVGRTNTGWVSNTPAQIAISAAENFTSSNMGSKINFSTVEIGATTSESKVLIDDDGRVVIADAAKDVSPNNRLHIRDSNSALGSSGSNVGIYTTDSFAVDVGGSIGFGGRDGVSTNRNFAIISGRKENATSSNYAGYMAFETRPNGGAAAERMRITSSGNIGIGNTTPDVALDVTGDIEYSGTITDVSDRRFKHDIQSIDGALDRLTAVSGVSFRMNEAPDRIEYGVIAQELEPIFPALVKTADDKMGSKSVNYIGLIAWVIEAVKELNDKFDTSESKLQKQLAEKDQKIEELEQRLEKIERALSSQEE